MEFEIRKRKRTGILPFVIAAGILLLAMGLYVWKYALADKRIPLDAEKSLAEDMTEPSTEEVIYAGSSRVTADLSGQHGQALTDDQARASLSSPDLPDADSPAASASRKNTMGIITTEHSESMNSFLQDLPEFSVVNEEPNYALFLISEEGFITAYLGDQTDIFEYTQIPITSFPQAQQEMLKEGLYMETFADYYDFLESYTS